MNVAYSMYGLQLVKLAEEPPLTTIQKRLNNIPLAPRKQSDPVRKTRIPAKKPALPPCRAVQLRNIGWSGQLEYGNSFDSTTTSC